MYNAHTCMYTLAIHGTLYCGMSLISQAAYLQMELDGYQHNLSVAMKDILT